MSIWLSSDYHFSHDREFIWKARGFESIDEMNQCIVDKHNLVVAPDDDVYVLGDLCLGGGSKEALAANKKLIEAMNGKLHIVYGNHDSAQRIEMYKTCKNVVENCGWATMLNYKKYHFYLSHFPTLTGNLENESLRKMTCCLYGHTHQRDNYYNDLPYCYHVGVDSHNCYPINLDIIIQQMKHKVNECIETL
jgi:calcineurin-like phosphoesterase family protein